ncbi:MAG: hypothetical protein GF341_09530 [candidate division Zixibacteria bacterium]|nr:hypothetical protein [candidate division Zixibacteria bacterium]
MGVASTRNQNSSTKLRVVVAQVPEQPHLAEIERIMRARRGSDLIVFPEGTLYVTDLAVVRTLKSWAQKYDTAIIIGIIHKDKRWLYDYTYYISGRLVERYQKTHVHWTETHIPGHEFKVIKTKKSKIGMLMCYDAAFQETSRVLTLMGADLIVIVSAIPIEFPSRFATLRARSIAYSNQVFLVHCCLPGRNFSGRSAIIDPHGDIVMELGKYTEVRGRTIDMDVVRKWREQEMTFEYRRPSIYHLISSLESPMSARLRSHKHRTWQLPR